MTSNSPTRDDETQSFPLNSPPLIQHTRTSIGIVSQSQERAVSQSHNEHSPSTQFDLLLRAHEAIDGIVEQTPVRGESTVASILTPIIRSPTKEQRLEIVRNRLFSPDAERIADSEQRRKKLIQNMKNSTRKCSNPSTTLLWFLRKTKLDATASGFKGPLKLANSYKSMGNGWHNNQEFGFAPFKAIKSTIQNGSNPLSQRHHRMLLEDALSLHPGDTIVCLITARHPLLKNPSFQRKVKDALIYNPLLNVVINKENYFAINLKVAANPLADNIAAGITSKKDLTEICTSERYGAGFMGEFESDKRLAPTHLFKFFNFLEHGDSIQFWQAGGINRLGHLKRVLTNVSAFDRISPTTMVLLKELVGDSSYSIHVSNCHDALIKSREAEDMMKVLKDEQLSSRGLKALFELDSTADDFVSFHESVEGICKNALDSCYGSFAELTTPILSAMVNLFKDKLTKYYSLFLTLLNKTKYANHSSKSTRQPYWDRMSMLLFISVMRMRNKHFFAWMGVINTAAYWTMSGGNISVIFGQKVTRATMVRKLTKLVTPAECERRTIACLSTLLFVKGAFDNTQHFVEQKFQREMISSLAHMATSSMYIFPDLPPLLDSTDFGTSKPKLTYYKQAIPSAYGMPLYHAVSQIKPETFLEDHGVGRHEGIDVTGKAVEQLAENICLANKIYDMHRLFEVDPNKKYHYQSDAAHAKMVKLNVFSKLAGCRDTRRYGTRAFFSQCYNYQLRETKSWRPDVKKASVIVPPLMPHDETTNIGAAKVILTMLRMVGILKVGEGESITDVRKLQLADDWEERTFMLTGDGLSQVRARTLDELISQSANRYGEHHETRIILKKALSRIVHVTGDLHGGNFHFLSAVYTVFYGALIQPIQTLLGWKRIRGTDVTKCYQQAAGLAILISDIVKKHLFDEFFIFLGNDALKWFDLDKVEDPAEFAVALGKAFLAWADEKRSTTDDELFVMSLNFMKMMEYYKLFRSSIRHGDAITIEWLYKEFLPLFLITGKHNYFEIDLGMIESFYHELPNKTLHLVRINRCTPLHDGVDRFRQPMANWAQDDLLEHIQPEYHTMPFNHSQHLVAKKRCLKFAQHEFTRASRKRDYSEMSSSPSTDPAQVRKATTVPKRQPEKDAVSEFISKVGMCNEIPGRVYCRKKFWSVLDQMDDDLIGKRKLAAMEKEMAMMSDGDRIMASWIDDLFAESKKKGGDDIPSQETERGAVGLLNVFNNSDGGAGNNQSEGGAGNNQPSDENIDVDDNGCNNINNDNNSEGDNDSDDDVESGEDSEMDDEPQRPQTEIEFSDVIVMDNTVGANEENEDDDDEDDEGNDEIDSSAEAPPYQTKKEVHEEVEIEVNVAKKRGKVNIRCAKINPLAFTDIISTGWKKLLKLDLVTTRFAAKEREKRKQEIREEVYQSIVGNANGVDTNTTMEGLSRLGIN